jgi:GDP-L-fucose synthase
MPANIYGPGDNFDSNSSHVLAALIRKFHEAKYNKSDSVTVWGSGNPKREFLYSEDLAHACLFLLEKYDDDSHINVGTGKDLSIAELAKTVSEVVGFSGEIVFDISKPDGTPRKLLDVSKLSDLGWEASIELREGIHRTYDWFLNNESEL